MRPLLAVLTAIIALLHLWFLTLEMFLWQHPLGLATFKQTAEQAAASATLAANQGLYNGFLAAGLLWSFLIDDPRWSLRVRGFFLGCVLVAGVYGGLTALRTILLIQALPALIALVLVFVLLRRIADPRGT
jgi:putative membrane protein